MPRKFKGQRLEWSEETLQWAISSIKSNLTRDLVPSNWKLANSQNPLGGHCHNATGALYMLFGPEYLQIYSGPTIPDPAAPDNGLHFWCVRKDNDQIIDITEAQYRLGYDYSVGRKSVMLGHSPYYNAKEVYNRVLSEYNGTTIKLF